MAVRPCDEWNAESTVNCGVGRLWELLCESSWEKEEPLPMVASSNNEHCQVITHNENKIINEAF